MFPEARRGLQYQDGIGCCDVECTAFYIECKVGQRTNIKAAIEQAKEDGKNDKRPKIAVTKDDGKGILVTMEWSTYEELLTRIYGNPLYILPATSGVKVDDIKI